MKLSTDNWGKPSNKRFKAIADALLYSMPLYLAAVVALPIDESIKIWVNFVVTVIVVTVKTISKLTSDDGI